MLFTCRLVEDPIRIEDPGGRILPILAAVTCGWDIAPAVAETRPAGIVVRRTRHGWSIAEAGHEIIHETTAVAAVCTLVVAILNRRIDHDPGGVFLHAAAVAIGGCTIVFPAAHRSGKSTLTAALALAGHAVVSDDILPLEGVAGIATGVLPRLRLPLPVGLRSRAEDKLEHYDDAYGYLTLPKGRCLGFGETRALDAVVIPQRRVGAAAHLVPADPAHALRVLLAQSHGMAMTPARLLDAASDIVDRCPAMILVYDDLDDAVALLAASAADGMRAADASGNTMGDRSFDRTSSRRRTPVTAGHANRTVRRRPGVDPVDRHGAAFLLHRDRGTLFALDPLGRAIWDVIEQPMAVTDLVDIVCAAFEGADRSVVTADILAFLDGLGRADLVSPGE